ADQACSAAQVERARSGYGAQRRQGQRGERLRHLVAEVLYQVPLEAGGDAVEEVRYIAGRRARGVFTARGSDEVRARGVPGMGHEAGCDAGGGERVLAARAVQAPEVQIGLGQHRIRGDRAAKGVRGGIEAAKPLARAPEIVPGLRVRRL